MTIVLDQPEQIAMARLSTLRVALRMEMLGMRRKGQSVYGILKDMGYQGTRQTIIETLTEEIDTYLNGGPFPERAWNGTPYQ